MKLTERWLRDWVDAPVPLAAIHAALPLAGVEVAAVEERTAPFAGVVVGHVLDVERHPAADRLSVCRVDVGEALPVQIVCGARNVRPGLRAPLARPGARLPAVERIGEAVLRGVASAGMLCSAAELGLDAGAEGLLELPANLAAGADLAALLGLPDTVFELELTPNRADCLGVLGVAREVAALLPEARFLPRAGAGHGVLAGHAASPNIHVAAPEACPLYLGCLVEDLSAEARTPPWMQSRLGLVGIRCIHPAVDVTNWLMLDLGQPLHAFDADAIEGSIAVRYARPGESIDLLDGRDVELAPDMLVIADDRGPIALAGIMGGRRTAVGAGTSRVLLEAAHFAPAAVAGRARRLGLHTDASHRFERGVDPALPRSAMQAAIALLHELAGGRPGPVAVSPPDAAPPPPRRIPLRAARLDALLGHPVAPAAVVERLERLGCAVEPQRAAPAEWLVSVPSHRFDLAIEVDLVEEVARLGGYDAIPAHPPSVVPSAHASTAASSRVRRLRTLLVDLGYFECVNLAFADPEMQALIDPGRAQVMLVNPLSRELGAMRTSLWAGLLRVLVHNRHRQQPRVRIFERGSGIERGPAGVVETPLVAGLACGPVQPEQWGMPARDVDFHDVKGDVERLLAVLQPGGPPARWSPAEHPALHPGQSACIQDERGGGLGWVGVLHPALARRIGETVPVVLWSLEPGRLGEGRRTQARAPSRYPSVRRDLALVVAAEVAAARLVEVARTPGPGLVPEVRIFDAYTGEGIEKGKKSVALALIFEAGSSTLVDEEVDAAVARIRQALADETGAELRS